MAQAGRKSLRDEIQVLRRYADLSGPYFAFLRESIESEDKDEKKWATEILTKAFVKMIPQETDLTSGGLPLILASEIIHKNAIAPHTSPENNSEGHPPIPSS
jgi:hypothetical protein